MNLGIKGRHALVCSASKGLGKGCAMALAREGVNVTITARTQSDPDVAAKEIRREAPDVTVTTVAGDITVAPGCGPARILVLLGGGYHVYLPTNAQGSAT